MSQRFTVAKRDIPFVGIFSYHTHKVVDNNNKRRVVCVAPEYCCDLVVEALNVVFDVKDLLKEETKDTIQ